MINDLTSLSELQSWCVDKLSLYAQFLTEWNEKINLISRKDIESIVPKHIVPCLAFNRVLKLADNARVIDIGTGGGFPGMVLAITNPKVKFTLVDSIRKKIGVLEDIVAKLNLDNVVLKCERAESLSGKYDFVVGRAVANLDLFLNTTNHLIRPGQKAANLKNGIVYLKGDDVLMEIKALRLKNVKTFNLKEVLQDEDYADKYLVHLY